MYVNPAASAVKRSAPTTATGHRLSSVDPSPSSPQGFPPQQYGAPLVVSAQVCVAPALTEAKLTTVTVMPAVSLTPSLVAITPAEPALTPVTRPFASTDATAASSVVQVIGRLRITLRFASRSVADSCLVACGILELLPPPLLRP